MKKPWWKRKRVWSSVLGIGLSIFVFFKPQYKPLVDETKKIIEENTDYQDNSISVER